MRSPAAVLIALFALPLFGQAVPTKCLTAEVKVDRYPKERLLVGCNASFTENLLWHLDRADSVDGTLDGVFRRRLTGRGAVIYIIDTGVLQKHVEFDRATGSSVIAGIQTSAALPGACTNYALEPCSQGSTHGTSVASIAGGRNIGLAPDAKIVAATGLAHQMKQWDEAIDGILKHAFDPASPPFRTAIINLSGAIIVKESEYAAFDDKIRRMTTGVDRDGNADANGKRFLFVFAALNLPVPTDSGTLTDNQCTPSGEPFYRPAILGKDIDGAVTVGGINRANRLWEYGCKGPLVEVAAPAENLFLASNGDPDHYRLDPLFYNSGTSYAAPYVAGIAAQYLELDPTLTPAQLEALLEASPSIVEGVPVPIAPASPYPKRRSAR